ncbi:hypothetical protein METBISCDRAFT_25245 [Metschnikowia bicuspidata]|uniref:Uncharacterized protein n=1 Tax=Metschnikowia bicuspidata TaxID=27322 RepID=A0A4P9ZJ30_9ASCO|nr:hypothetical protein METBISCDRAFT_25245 [Metschnikowia bicuspidata]
MFDENDSFRTRGLTLCASSYNSLYSSVKTNSVDLELESVRLPFENLTVTKPKESRLMRVQLFLTGNHALKQPLDENDKFYVYVEQSTIELGELRFSNLSSFNSSATHVVSQLLRHLQPQLATFNDILDLYALSNENITRFKLFETSLESNYQDSLIIEHLRKPVRLALVKERLGVSRYLKKDNVNALATSLHSLGEYQQFVDEHDRTVSLWEMNCHLTEDADSDNLAILGLPNGYGYGNMCKKQNHFGSRSKKHRYETKRRIAHIYRILMKKSDFDEYGVSWATNEKYD